MTAPPTAWDQGSWDQPANATWDPPPAPPPPPKKKKKPFHRVKPPQPPAPIPTHTMSTLKYTVGPLPGGGFTARAVRGGQVEEASMTTAIAAAAGIEAEKVPLVIQAFADQILQAAARSDWSPGLYSAFNFRPTCGGSQPMPNGFQTPDEINADIAISFSAEKIRQWRAGLSIQSMGEVGLITPIIDSILDITTGQQDKYTAANMIQIRGNDLRFQLSDTTQGVFFRSGSDAEVRATLYGQNEPSVISAGVPAALSGPLNVRVAAFINGSVRSYTYTHAITAVA